MTDHFLPDTFAAMMHATSSQRVLSLPILISMVMGSMIGTGVYILPASLATYGSIALLSWLYTGVGALLLALVFAHLSQQFPQTGGPYLYCKEAFGKGIGLVVLYIYWISNLVSIAGLAVSSVGYIESLCPVWLQQAYSPDTIHLSIALLILGCFTIINILGIQLAGTVQLCLTLFKVVPMLGIILLGMRKIVWHHLLAFNVSSLSNVAALSQGAVLTFWAFIGLESAVVPAENTINHRARWQATVWGTVATSMLYVLSTFILMAMIPSQQLQLSTSPFTDAATILFGHYGAMVMTVCIILSALGAVNVTMIVQAQVALAGARDHAFPAIFSRLSSAGSPIIGHGIAFILVSVYLIMLSGSHLLKQFNAIILLAALFTLLTYLMSALSALQLASKRCMTYRGFLLQPMTWVAVLAAVYAMWMISQLDKNIIVIGLIVLLLSVPIYLVMRWKTVKVVS